MRYSKIGFQIGFVYLANNDHYINKRYDKTTNDKANDYNAVAEEVDQE